MNAERRLKLNEALILVGEAKAIIEEVHEQEEGAYENLPESLQYSARGAAMQGAVSALDDAVNACEEIDEKLNEAREG